MGAVELLEELQSCGVAVFLDQDELVLRPGSQVPPDLIPILKQSKREIVEHLRQWDKERQQQPYQQAYSGDGPSEDELAEIEGRVNEAGYVLCWSEVLEDFIAFHREDVDPATIPPGFVAYSLTELTYLFREDREPLSVNALRLVHQAKKHGARVNGNCTDGTQEPQT